MNEDNDIFMVSKHFSNSLTLACMRASKCNQIKIKYFTTTLLWFPYHQL